MLSAILLPSKDRIGAFFSSGDEVSTSLISTLVSLLDMYLDR